MKNSDTSIKIIRRIATALGDLNEKVFFVGGSVVSLYVIDPAAEDVRPTEDVDITFNIPTAAELEVLRETLVQKGFLQSSEYNVVCRFRYDDIIVDVMSTEDIIWAPANRWFKSGLNDLQKINLDGISINILSLSHFLCTKFDAYSDRGSADPRQSKDFEDIIYLLDNVSEITSVVQNAQEEVKVFIKHWFKKILEDRSLREAVYGQLPYEIREERFKLIINKLENCLTV